MGKFTTHPGLSKRAYRLENMIVDGYVSLRHILLGVYVETRIGQGKVDENLRHYCRAPFLSSLP